MLHQLAERLVDHAMASDDRFSGKARRDDRHAPVGFAAGLRAGVSLVLRALVDDIEAFRLQGCQPLADLRRYAHCLSSTYFARTSDCSTAKSSIRPMPPKSLKVAHT